MNPESASSADELVQLCAFAAGEEEYVVDLRRVSEIVNPLPITPVPRAPEFIEGVVNLRGRVVPVVDVCARLGVARRTEGRRERLILVKIGRQELALRVDSVVEVVRLPRGQIKPATGLSEHSGPPIFLGVCGGGRKGGSRLRLLLDVKGLLGPSAPAAAAAERGAQEGNGP